MGEVLAIGMTHYPGLVIGPERASGGTGQFIDRALKNPNLPEHLRTPEGWPEEMRKEWGDDEGASARRRHLQALVDESRKMRKVLDDFRPDFVVIWGDDQYENFREDIIPPFCIHAYDTFEVKPWFREAGRGRPGEGQGMPNAWNEPPDKTFVLQGHHSGARYLVKGLLEENIDMSYAYQPLHKDLAHAFWNTVAFLDWDRQGWDHRIVPFQVNCYGSRVISWRGLFGPDEAEPDPPFPSPTRCFDVGAATARVMARSPWRVAIIGSSSWSHAFLTKKNYYLYPDIETDRELYQALKAGDFAKWRSRTPEQVEASGHQELLNWYCLAGAVSELGRKPDYSVFIEGWLSNSPKCYAYWKP